jgi:hypothetical protein
MNLLEIENDIASQIERAPLPTLAAGSPPAALGKPTEPTQEMEPDNDEQESQQSSGSGDTHPPNVLEGNDNFNPEGLLDPEGWDFHPEIHEKDKSTGFARKFHGKLKRKKGWLDRWEKLKQENDWIKPYEKTPPPPPPPQLEELNIPEEAQENTDPEAEQVEAEEMTPDEVRKMLDPNMTNRQLAELIANTYIGGGYRVAGKGFLPMDIGNGRTDRDEIIDSWENYLNTVGAVIPAWAMPVITMGNYAAGRILTDAETRGAFKNLYLWSTSKTIRAANKFLSWFRGSPDIEPEPKNDKKEDE